MISFQIITKGNGSVILKYMNLDSSFLKLRGIRCYKTFNDKKKWNLKSPILWIFILIQCFSNTFDTLRQSKNWSAIRVRFSVAEIFG